MRHLLSQAFVVVFLCGVFSIGPNSKCQAALVTNAPLPISHILTINPIIVSNTAGGDTATFMGNPTEETAIKGFVDTIWAQAGIDVQWRAPMSLNSTQTLVGSGTITVARSLNDLSNDPSNDHVSIGNVAGVRVANTINMFFVNIAAGFKLLPANMAAGLAEVPGDDISMFIGAMLPTFPVGQEVAAMLIAHEIGHNLNLLHTSGLMLTTITHPDATLSVSQVSSANTSGTLNGRLLVAVPESSAFLLVGSVALVGLSISRPRQRRSAA